MDFECTFQSELQELEPRPSLSIRTRTAVSSLQEVFDDGYASIVRFLETRGKRPGGPRFALYFNMGTDDLEVEFGFPVEEGIEGEGAIRNSTTPSGRAVSTLYIGPYEEVEPAYTAMMKWAGDSGLALSGVSYEVYLSDPSVTPPEQLRTRIHLLLA